MGKKISRKCGLPFWALFKSSKVFATVLIVLFTTCGISKREPVKLGKEIETGRKRVEVKRHPIEKEVRTCRMMPASFGILEARTSKDESYKPLEIKSHIVNVAIVDGSAKTEIDELFLNNENTQKEGIFYFSLPAGASISRLAMYIVKKEN